MMSAFDVSGGSVNTTYVEDDSNSSSSCDSASGGCSTRSLSGSNSTSVDSRGRATGASTCRDDSTVNDSTSGTRKNKSKRQTRIGRQGAAAGTSREGQGIKDDSDHVENHKTSLPKRLRTAYVELLHNWFIRVSSIVVSS